ncbi:NAD(P)-binding domain-containing protein [Streptomyces sp. Ag82_O1-15]|uniref:NAD(P)-binding domain-containing protein n=1 Tax=Streptomyces sp. Ag82_O1-15 TaxID=1938855 RepID=UPI0026C9A036
MRVAGVHRDGELLRVETDLGTWSARAVISATGIWRRPFLPAVPGRGDFGGAQLHTVEYRTPQEIVGRRVIVAGGGNSGAQIAADLAHDTELTWVTQRPPRFLADDIDGRALFDAATARRRALDEGGTDTGGVASLGDIVAVPPVRAARDGVQASARRSPTSLHSSCGKRVAVSSPPAPRPWPNHACICSATATGPGRPPPH